VGIHNKVFETMKFTKSNEEAVSPVIGVILMVAITVILAAVIAAFVFGMAGNISKTKTVAITAQHPTATTIIVTNMGGQDVGTLSSLSITGDVTGSVGNYTGNTTTLATTAGAKHVIVTGTFIDGSTQVLLDTNV
jgi:archaeal type IV pilus assembly protein PilA